VQCGKEIIYISDNKQFKIYNYPIVDNDKYNIAQHFDEIYQIIHSAIKEGGVLVHCLSDLSIGSYSCCLPDAHISD
jgi:protein-tyrosine phosphatase